MSKPNRHGCKPSDDVCLVHCEPRVCGDETAYGERDESVAIVNGRRVRGVK